MKQIIIILGLILSINYAQCQTDFQLWLNNTNNEYSRDLVELADGGFVISIASQTDFDSSLYTKIQRYSASGSLIKEINIVNPEWDCRIENLVLSGDSLIVGIGEWKHHNQNSEIWYLGMDTQLNIVFNKKYEVNNVWFEQTRSFVSSEGNIVTCATIAPYMNPSQSSVYLIETTLNGDTLRSKYLYSGHTFFVHDIFQFNGLYSILAFINGSSLSQIVRVDTNFNIASLDSIPHDFNNCISGKISDDNRYYLAGNVPVGLPSRDIGVMLLDENNQPLRFANVGKPADTIDFGGAQQSMDFINSNTIFIGGISNVDVNIPYYSPIKSWYSLYCFDSLLNLKWTKFYGGDAYYFLFHVVATSDGGAILSGTRYDSNTPDNKLDIYILKVDENGLITSTSDMPPLTVSEAIVYPNPGSTQLTIETALKGLQFELYSTNGQTVVSQPVNNGTTTVNTSALPAGMYFYRFMNKDKMVESGKWVKE